MIICISTGSFTAVKLFLPCEIKAKVEKMTFFGRNGHFVGVRKENKHGDPQFFFHFLIDNDNMYKYWQFHSCKIIFTM